MDESDERMIGKMMPLLDEHQRRVFLGLYCEKLGYGSATQISDLTGMSPTTLTAAKKEVQGLKCDPRARPSAGDGGRIRAEGGGRKSILEKHPEIRDELLKLLDGNVLGDPESLITWTVKSTYTLAKELKEKGYSVSNTTVGTMLKQMDFSLQQNKKYTESGDPGPDRDPQFRYIASESARFMERGLPVISVDAKKKENVGNFKNDGAEYRPIGKPRLVNDHDFCTRKAVPYGVFDVGRNEGFVNVGVGADTGQFAVESISSWWFLMGQFAYPDAKEIMITADGGGSNGSRLRLWKYELQKLADFTGITFHVRHYPPGTSKWNKIEHRMFSFISMNWKGRPLESYEIIVNLIGSTTNESGLRIKCVLDEWEYESGILISDEEFATINLKRDDWHGDWNYTISPHQ